MATLTALRGTHDLVAPEILRWQEIEAAARRVLHCACFDEIRTPLFERTELFERGVGRETDIVRKEMFTFSTRADKRGKSTSLTLRPENTAGVVRAYLELGLASKAPSPLKLWYLGPMFRYERPQKGRQRQFHQLGVEILGSPAPAADAEVILAACELLRELGLTDFVVDVNSLGDPADRARYRDALAGFLRERREDLDEDSRDRIERNPLRVLDSKNRGTQEVLEEAPALPDFLGAEAREHFEEVLALLDTAGVKFRRVPNMVRGLDYYSRTTFEIQSSELGAQSQICGGGRYDGLVKELGGPAVPAVGWALGIERLAIVLEAMHGAPAPEGPLAYVVPVGSDALGAALSLARDLRRAGVRCDVSLSGGSPGKQLKAADRRGARFAVLLGEDEVKRGAVSLKELETGEQEDLAVSRLAARLLQGEKE